MAKEKNEKTYFPGYFSYLNPWNLLKKGAATLWDTISSCSNITLKLPPKTLLFALLASELIPGTRAANNLIVYLKTAPSLGLRLTIHDPNAPTIGEEFANFASDLLQGKYCNITKGDNSGHYATLYRYFYTALGDRIETAELATTNITQAQASKAVDCINTILEQINTDEYHSRDFAELSLIILGIGIVLSCVAMGYFIQKECCSQSNNNQERTDIEMESTSYDSTDHVSYQNSEYASL